MNLVRASKNLTQLRKLPPQLEKLKKCGQYQKEDISLIFYTVSLTNPVPAASNSFLPWRVPWKTGTVQPDLETLRTQKRPDMCRNICPCVDPAKSSFTELSPWIWTCPSDLLTSNHGPPCRSLAPFSGQQDCSASPWGLSSRGAIVQLELVLQLLGQLCFLFQPQVSLYLADQLVLF